MEDDIKKTIEVLNSGGAILYPTETVWGLGCDATNIEAVKKVFDIKKRTIDKHCLILLDDINKLWDYVRSVPDVALDILEINNSPLTIIYPQAYNLPSELIAEDGSIGIRITSDLFCKKLINKFRRPLISTSANISGEDTPQNFSQISNEVKSSVDYIVKLRQESKKKSKPSGIIKVGENNQVKVIRE